MKKLTIAAVISVLLSACTSVQKTPTKADFVGEWSCKTAYPDVRVGTIDLLTLNADGTMLDDNFIFDNSLDILLEKETTNYFSSPYKYLRISTGKWSFDNNQLVYHLTQKEFKRIIFKDVFAQMQKTPRIKAFEQDLFKVYSANHNDEAIQLNFKKFIKNGFVLTQTTKDAEFESICQTKESAEFDFNGKLEVYKMIHQAK